MISLLMIPFIVQAVAIAFDEFYFHIKRGLPRWERIGHPIDTLTLLLCSLVVLLLPLTPKTLVGYIILAIISCLCVTKDEWIHKEHCSGKEQWLHALLFLNHPLVLIAYGLLWQKKTLFFPFFIAQTLFTTLFFFYQLIYWNLIWQEK